MQFYILNHILNKTSSLRHINKIQALYTISNTYSCKMEILQARKSKIKDTSDLHNLSKEDLIEKIKSLQSHNLQLRNVIAKSSTGKVKKRQKKAQKPFDFSTCTFRHVLLRFAYLGWDYQGYAIQEDTNSTIEHHLFEALVKTCLIKDRNCSNYHRCGRTDKGVSSFGQVISIDLRSRLSEEAQDDVEQEISYCSILNKVLPENIQCIAWCPVNNDFSARFDCKSRTYKYFFPKGSLDIETRLTISKVLQKMQTAAKYLLGTHDFRNFCKMDVGNGVVKFFRNISAIDILPYSTRPDHEEHSMCVATINGQAFLWHQIRCIMGVLFLVGLGKEDAEIVQELLDIEKNCRKPDYNMASEVPLNLYHCEYHVDSEWKYDFTALNLVIRKLQSMWTFNSIKTTMLEQMLQDLQKVHNEYNTGEKDPYVNCLLNGVKSKKYIPLLQRQKCDSLEDRINHFVKKQKLEILNQISSD